MPRTSEDVTKGIAFATANAMKRVRIRDTGAEGTITGYSRETGYISVTLECHNLHDPRYIPSGYVYFSDPVDARMTHWSDLEFTGPRVWAVTKGLSHLDEVEAKIRAQRVASNGGM